MTRTIHKLLVAALGSLALTTAVQAAEWSGYRYIKDFGCHKYDGTCYVTVDGASVSGGTGCTSNSIRWNSQTDVGGKNWLALVLYAKALNRRVGFQIESCYSNQPEFPTFSWGKLEN